MDFRRLIVKLAPAARWRLASSEGFVTLPPVRHCEDVLQGYLEGVSPAPVRFGFALVSDTQLLMRFYRESQARRRIRAADTIFAANLWTAWLLQALYGAQVPVCSTLDVVQRTFEVCRPNDRVLWVGSGGNGVRAFGRRFGLTDVRIHPAEGALDLTAVFDFLENNSPFRFCLLALPSAAREAIAHAAFCRQRARGLALCLRPLQRFP